MTESDPPTSEEVFIVRYWPVDDVSGITGRRASVFHVRSQGRLFFKDDAELCAFIARQLKTPP